MTSRPADLPNFLVPPVSEVVLGVQFNGLERMLAPHLGLVWTEFRGEYPLLEQHPPIAPVFETFSEGGGPLAPQLSFQLLKAPPTPRVFFINAERTELVQIQSDRFIHNWRKVISDNIYPRFEPMLETFQKGYRKLDAFVQREGIGLIVPNQCEVTYINQISIKENQTSFAAFEQTFPAFSQKVAIKTSGKPEDTRFMLRYVIPDPSGEAVGRLIVSAEPAWRPDGSNIIHFTLVARGKPKTGDLAGVVDFLLVGRQQIVRAFAELTSAEMQVTWGRTQ